MLKETIIHTNSHICLCCGERKQIVEGETYCADCTCDNIGAFLSSVSTTPKVNLYVVKASN